MNYPEVTQRYRTTKDTKYQRNRKKWFLNSVAIVSLQWFKAGGISKFAKSSNLYKFSLIIPKLQPRRKCFVMLNIKSWKSKKTEILAAVEEQAKPKSCTFMHEFDFIWFTMSSEDKFTTIFNYSTRHFGVFWINVWVWSIWLDGNLVIQTVLPCSIWLLVVKN